MKGGKVDEEEENEKTWTIAYTEKRDGVKPEYDIRTDRFNNWLSTEWIDGTNGINEITAIQITDNKLSMDALIIQKKIFDMLNRVAISGGSYNDWQEAVYGVKVARMAESPIYMGGASYEIVFSEVVSQRSRPCRAESYH